MQRGEALGRNSAEFERMLVKMTVFAAQRLPGIKDSISFGRAYSALSRYLLCEISRQWSGAFVSDENSEDFGSAGGIFVAARNTQATSSFFYLIG